VAPTETSLRRGAAPAVILQAYTCSHNWYAAEAALEQSLAYPVREGKVRCTGSRVQPFYVFPKPRSGLTKNKTLVHGVRHTLSSMPARICVWLSKSRTLHPPALRVRLCRIAACCLTGFKIQLVWQNLQTLANACWRCMYTGFGPTF